MGSDAARANARTEWANQLLNHVEVQRYAADWHSRNLCLRLTNHGRTRLPRIQRVSTMCLLLHLRRNDESGKGATGASRACPERSRRVPHWPGGDARLSISLSQHYRLRDAARRCARDAASVAGFSFATSS